MLSYLAQGKRVSNMTRGGVSWGGVDAITGWACRHHPWRRASISVLSCAWRWILDSGYWRQSDAQRDYEGRAESAPGNLLQRWHQASSARFSMPRCWRMAAQFWDSLKRQTAKGRTESRRWFYSTDGGYVRRWQLFAVPTIPLPDARGNGSVRTSTHGFGAMMPATPCSEGMGKVPSARAVSNQVSICWNSVGWLLSSRGCRLAPAESEPRCFLVPMASRVTIQPLTSSNSSKAGWL